MSLMICSEGVFAVPDFCLIFAPRLATMSQKSSFPHPTDSVQYVLTSNTFAEFERSIIRHRVRAGLKRAVASGKRLGRPKIDPAIEKRIQAELRTKKGMLAIAKGLKVGTGTVQRIKREMERTGPFDGVSAAA